MDISFLESFGIEPVLAEILKMVSLAVTSIVAVISIFGRETVSHRTGKLTFRGRVLLLLALIGLFSGVGLQLYQFLESKAQAALLQKRHREVTDRLELTAKSIEHERLLSTPIRELRVIVYFDDRIDPKLLLSREGFMGNLSFVEGGRYRAGISFYPGEAINPNDMGSYLIPAPGTDEQGNPILLYNSEAEKEFYEAYYTATEELDHAIIWGSMNLNAKERISLPLHGGGNIKSGILKNRIFDELTGWSMQARISTIAIEEKLEQTKQNSAWSFERVNDLTAVQLILDIGGTAKEHVHSVFLVINDDLIIDIPAAPVIVGKPSKVSEIVSKSKIRVAK